MKTGSVFIFSAPSGAGKTTIVREVLKARPGFAFSVSATTRAARQHEVDGKDYFFLSKEAFLEKIEQGDFLEWEEVYSGLYYGSLKSEVDRLLEEGHCVVFDVDVHGGINIKNHYGDAAVSFFISPPDPETLRIRLEKRGTDSPEAIAFRMAKAKSEMAYADQFDHVILNDVLKIAVDSVLSHIDAHLSESQLRQTEHSSPEN
jgi:guanylate kinase